VPGYSPVTAGLAFLPLSGAVVVSSQLVAGRLLPWVAPRLLIVPGLLVAAVAMGLFTQHVAPRDAGGGRRVPAPTGQHAGRRS
jgi:hypothetical protein